MHIHAYYLHVDSLKSPSMRVTASASSHSEVTTSAGQVCFRTGVASVADRTIGKQQNPDPPVLRTWSLRHGCMIYYIIICHRVTGACGWSVLRPKSTSLYMAYRWHAVDAIPRFYRLSRQSDTRADNSICSVGLIVGFSPSANTTLPNIIAIRTGLDIYFRNYRNQIPLIC